MRRSVLLVVLCFSFVFAACEDGPNQTFSPATGTQFNNGQPPPAIDDAAAPLNGSYAGHTKQEICSGDELQRQWAAMVNEPIRPPRFMAGIDLAGGDKFPGLSVEDAEQGPITPINTTRWPANPRLCQPVVDGPGPNGSDVGGSLQVHWGNNSEVVLEWAVPTHKAWLLSLNPGYTGTMEWDYKGSHYVWQIQRPIQKNGRDYIIHWNLNNANDPRTVADIDELYRGIVSYFIPEVYQDTPTSCAANGTCLITPGGNQDGTGRALFGIRPAAFYIYTGNPATSEIAGSTVRGAYIYNVKGAPYSVSNTTLKMFDVEGPTSTASAGDLHKDCMLRLGGTFQDLLDNCINVFSSAQTNTTALDKVLGNIKHDDQNFEFSVIGVNQNYRPVALDMGAPRQFDIIHDSDSPLDDPKNNYAVDFTFDVRTYGPILNDWYTTTDKSGAPIHKKDLHGSGAVWKEYAREVQTDLANAYVAAHPTPPPGAEHWPRTLHDPACYFPMCNDATTGHASPACAGLDYEACVTRTSGGASVCTWALPTDFDPYAWRAPEGCTGFEGFISPAESTGPYDIFDDYTTASAAGAGGFKPGGPSVVFCNDPHNANSPNPFPNFCGINGDLIGTNTDMFVGSYTRVLQYLGHGDLKALPTEARDLRYYFKKFATAYAKYVSSPHSADLGKHVNCTHNPAFDQPNRPDGTTADICAGPPQPVGEIASQFIDTDYMFFDSFGAGGSQAEYVSFENVDAKHDPTSLQLKALLVGSNLQDVHFYRRLDREERALFMAMAIDKSKPSWGYLNNAQNQPILDEYGFKRRNASMFLSNLAGSTAIANIGYAPALKGGAPIPAPAVNGVPVADPCSNAGSPATKTAYYCATHLDDDCVKYSSNNLQAPVDAKGALIKRDNGKPIFEGYCGIFNPTPFALATQDSVSPIKVLETYPLIESAKIEIPTLSNPYDLTSENHPIQVLVPWKPKQEGVGFPVAATGTRDVFVQTSQLDFSGQVVTPVMDFQPVQVTSKSGAPYTGVHIMAYETQDFLGDVFLCVDPGTAANRVGTGNPGDILYAHMYTSAATLLDWISAHPGAQDACGIIVRYSPYNNFPDYIQSTSAGIRLNIEQGAGLGRVSDVTVFQPGLGAPVAP